MQQKVVKVKYHGIFLKRHNSVHFYFDNLKDLIWLLLTLINYMSVCNINLHEYIYIDLICLCNKLPQMSNIVFIILIAD